MDSELSFGQWLRRRRRGLDLTQRELGQRVGYSSDAVRKVEADELRPSRQLAEKLAEVLDIPLMDRPAFIRFARDTPGSDELLPALPAPTLTSPPPPARPPTNLPTPPTRLIGRETDVAAVHDWLVRSDVHLVTLTGPGGIGKTRLGLQVAADARPEFADGVYFIDLAPISDPTLLASTIAQTLGLQPQGSQPFLALLKAYLRDKTLLLLLDNFEQIVSAAPVVAELLAYAPGVKVIVTSRVVLRLQGEHQYPVPPLLSPDPRQLSPVEQLTQYDAVRLFIERAQAARPDFDVNETNASAIAAICYHLDGLPLAIELAAARSRLFTPQTLVERLASRLGFLTGGGRDLPARQQTLRDAIGWSYDLLEAAEKTLVRRLAVFVGGFTLAAAEAVCGQHDDLDILAGVASLVDQSLLVPMPVDGQSGSQAQPTDEERFTMLATIREFALERLVVEDHATEIQRRYADYFVVQAEEVYRGHSTANHTVWLRWLVREQNNIRAVLRWATTRPDDLTGVRLAGALAFDWLDGGYLVEGCQWLHAVLSQPAGQARTFERGRALVGVGALETIGGDKAIAIRVLEEGIRIYRALDYQPGLVRALATLGMARSNRGVEEEGVALGRAIGDAWNTALALRFLSVLAINGAEARAFLQEGLALARRTGDQVLLGILYTGLGQAELKLGNYTEAETALCEALDLRQAAGNKFGAAIVLGMLGEVEKGRGDWAQAMLYSGASLGLQRSMGHSVRIVLQLRRLGFATLERGDMDQARSLFQEALTRLEQPDTGAVCVCLLGLAGVAARRGDMARMARLWGAAEALRQVDGTPWPPDEQADVERTLATLRGQADDTAFTTLWAEGQAMPLDEAVNYALSARVSGSAHI